MTANYANRQPFVTIHVIRSWQSFSSFVPARPAFAEAASRRQAKRLAFRHAGVGGQLAMGNFWKSPEIPDYTDYEPITRITNAGSEK
jgi:hypothetical protein